MVKKIVFILVLVIVFVVAHNYFDCLWIVESSSQKTYLSENEINALRSKALKGDPGSASYLVDYYLDHEQNKEVAAKWMKLAVKNGATWYNEQDFLELQE